MSFCYRALLVTALLLSVATVRVINRQNQPTISEQFKVTPQTSPAKTQITAAPSEFNHHKSLHLKEKDRNQRLQGISEDSSISQSSSKDSDEILTLQGLAKHQQFKKSLIVPKKHENLRFNKKRNNVQSAEKTKDSKQDNSEGIDTFSTFSIIFIYITSFIAVLFMLKQFKYPEESTLQVAVLTAIKFRSYFKLSRGGYKAPQYIQEIDNQSVYNNNEYHGKEFYWERDTTVEGI